MLTRLVPTGSKDTEKDEWPAGFSDFDPDNAAITDSFTFLMHQIDVSNAREGNLTRPLKSEH